MHDFEKLHYQEGYFNWYRVTWYGGSSNQLHFQKRSMNTESSSDDAPEWIDVDCRTMIEFPTRVKELWQEMRDYYSYCLEMESYRVFN